MPSLLLTRHPSPLHFTALGLGSNLDDPAAKLNQAATALDALEDFELLAASSLYASAPWGDTDQPEFRNAVVLGRTALAPRDLLARLQSIESMLGKRPIRRWGPRAIDIDLLLYGDNLAANEEGLTLPHPHIRHRPFVVRPLAEAARELTLASNQRLAVPPSWSPFLELTPEGQALDSQTQRLAPRPNPIIPASSPLTPHPSPLSFNWPSSACPRAHAVVSRTADSTHTLGRILAPALAPNAILALNGTLGAGKSCLVRGLAQALGHSGPVPSPSYTLCREYQTPHGQLQHWDFYRLEGSDDLESTAFLDKLQEPAIVAVEWAERFEEVLPEDRTIHITVTPDPVTEARRIEFRFPPGTYGPRVALQSWEFRNPQ